MLKLSITNLFVVAGVRTSKEGDDERKKAPVGLSINQLKEIPFFSFEGIFRDSKVKMIRIVVTNHCSECSLSFSKQLPIIIKLSKILS